MRIFISNDDGVKAPGLRYLVECMREFGELTVVAPDSPRSGQSGAITVGTPLMIKRCEGWDGADVYSTTGTPVDCVKLAMHTIFKDEKPDLMVCGINHGTNAGNCVLYSGTMGAVMEASCLGIPAIGFSLTDHSLEADFSGCRRWVKEVVNKVLRDGLPTGVCLNVNIPARCVPHGIKWVRAAHGHWTGEYAEYTTPGGTPFYWLTGRFENDEPEAEDTDEYWLARGWVSAVGVATDNSVVIR